jgi:hypothetical protein
MSNSRSKDRAAIIGLQSAIGFFGLVAWVLLSAYFSDETLIHEALTLLPFLITFELGVLSRYIPGLKTVAKRLR